MTVKKSFIFILLLACCFTAQAQQWYIYLDQDQNKRVAAYLFGEDDVTFTVMCEPDDTQLMLLFHHHELPHKQGYRTIAYTIGRSINTRVIQGIALSEDTTVIDYGMDTQDLIEEAMEASYLNFVIGDPNAHHYSGSVSLIDFPEVVKHVSQSCVPK